MERQRAVLGLVDQSRRAIVRELWGQFEVSFATLRNELRETTPDLQTRKTNWPSRALATAIRLLIEPRWLGETSLAQLASAGTVGCLVADTDGLKTSLREERGAEVLAAPLAAVAKGA